MNAERRSALLASAANHDAAARFHEHPPAMWAGRMPPCAMNADAHRARAAELRALAAESIPRP